MQSQSIIEQISWRIYIEITYSEMFIKQTAHILQIKMSLSLKQIFIHNVLIKYYSHFQAEEEHQT